MKPDAGVVQLVPARRFATLGLAALFVSACANGGGPGGLSLSGPPGVTGYQEGNAIMPQGYQVVSSSGDTIKVRATGSASTPNERLLKIALAHAAQYGDAQYSKTFRAGEPSYNVRCGKTSASERGTTRAIAPIDYRVVEVDVTFSKSATTDPADRAVKETAAALLAEIQAETVPEETQRALVAQLAQACGRTPT